MAALAEAYGVENVQVHGFEMQKEQAAKLEKTLQAKFGPSSKSHLHVHVLGASNTEGELMMCANGWYNKWHLKQGNERCKEAAAVPITKLDTFAKTHEFGRVEYIKIDTEGHGMSAGHLRPGECVE
jgi:FkbM family methyltransferase